MEKALFVMNFNSQVGFGHLSRCSIIAEHLQQHNWENILLTQASSSISKNKLSTFSSVHNYDESNIFEKLKSLHKKLRFSTLIIDDYEVDYKTIIRDMDSGVNILRFELNPAVDDKSSTIINYNPLYSNSLNTNHLLGPDYALISNKFMNLTKENKDQVLVFFGGGSDQSALEKYEDYLEFLNERVLTVNIAITSSYINKDQIIERYKLKEGVNILVDSELFPLALNNSRFALISGGTVIYEAAYLKTPMQIVSVADNQVKQAEAWGSNGNAKYLGDVSQVDSAALKNSFERHFRDLSTIETWYSKRDQVVDGLGSERIADFIIKYTPC